MYFGNRHLWRYRCTTGMAGVNMNESAFPWSVDDGQKIVGNKGMTLRDYFAAQALTGAQIWDAVLNGKDSNFLGSRGGVNLLAEISYAVADAMLKERTKE